MTLFLTQVRSRHAFACVYFVIMPLAHAEACPVCWPIPTSTAADFLIESETVVFARESLEQPFAFSMVELIKGDSVPGVIDLFVDSATRRRLKTNPNHAVVLVREGKDKPWKNLGIAKDDYKAVVRRVLMLANEWNDRGGRFNRHLFFISLLGHENPTIFELAYLELGRAPYSTIKQVAGAISPDDLHSLLQKREYIEWRPLAILILAQNATKQDRRFIEDSFKDCQRFSLTTNLAAWATACIELNESDAVVAIEEAYLRDTNRTEAEVRAVITALSVHGREGHVHLRDRIARSYMVALEFHPESAGMIANDLYEWKKWEYREDFAKLLAESDNELEMWEAKAIQTYLK